MEKLRINPIKNRLGMHAINILVIFFPLDRYLYVKHKKNWKIVNKLIYFFPQLQVQTLLTQLQTQFGLEFVLETVTGLVWLIVS